MLRSATRIASAIAFVVAAACSDSLLEPAVACTPPALVRAAIDVDTTNGLRAFATAIVSGLDSAAVRYGPGTARDSAAPPVRAAGDSVTVPILGLLPTTSYGAQLIAYGACATPATFDLPSFTSGALPADLPAYAAGGFAPAPGYVVLAAGKYGIVIDNSGRVVWYHRFPDGPGLNFQAQPNGRYVARPPAALGAAGAFVEIDPAGRVTRTLGCARGLPARMHDMIADRGGDYWLLCDEVRTVDLSAQGKPANARVLGTAVQHRAANGDLLFEWSPFDHFDVELGLLDPADRDAAVINWTHGNALDLDPYNGGLLVSFRNLNEVTKIDTRTGDVRWRFGGAHDDFALNGGAAPPFVHQHGVRSVDDGVLQLLDNLGHADGSRAEVYRLDEQRRTASLATELVSPMRLVAQVGGTTQSSGAGRTLVSYGSGAGVEEYDAEGNVVWQLTGNPGYVFRAQRIRSLYYPGSLGPR